MASNTPYPVREAPPKALINLLLMGGLAGIAYAIITQKLLKVNSNTHKKKTLESF